MTQQARKLDGAQSGRKTDMKDIDRLILQLSEGDMSALEALYDRTKTAVYGLSMSILRRPQDAEDVMQDTYIRIYEGSSGYRAKGKPMAWILRIARNLSFDKLRLRTERDLSLEEEWLPDENSDFSESAIDRILLTSMLDQLPEVERQIVILHSVERFKHREIAEILNIPLGTALSKYHRSLSKLRKMLEE